MKPLYARGVCKSIFFYAKGNHISQIQDMYVRINP